MVFKMSNRKGRRTSGIMGQFPERSGLLRRSIRAAGNVSVLGHELELSRATAREENE